jgi:hypothetical protein
MPLEAGKALTPPILYTRKCTKEGPVSNMPSMVLFLEQTWRSHLDSKPAALAHGYFKIKSPWVKESPLQNDRAVLSCNLLFLQQS